MLKLASHEIQNYLRDKGLTFRRRGSKAECKVCPFCDGGEHSDAYTFVVYLDATGGNYKCQRGKCAVSGSFWQLAEHFGDDPKEFYQKNPFTPRKNFGGKPEQLAIVPELKPNLTFKSETVEPQKLTAAALAYLEKRGFEPEVLDEMPIWCDEKGLINFGYYHEGELCMVKVRKAAKPDKGDQKAWQKWKGGLRTLWGLEMCDFTNPYIVITFGEYDAVALRQARIENVVSVPCGDSDLEWINVCYEQLKELKEIYLWIDNDEAGKLSLPRIAARLDARKIKVVSSDYKDANEMLLFETQKVGAAAAEQMLTQAVYDAKWLYKGDVMQFADIPESEINFNGYKTGISILDTLVGGMLKGRLTLHAGSNKAGKALALNTLIPTARGWTTMQDIQIGEKVFDENGKACNVIAKSAILTDSICYKITFTDGSEFVCDANHEWETFDLSTRASLYNARRRFAETGGVLRKSGTDQKHKQKTKRIVLTKEIAETLEDAKGRKNHAVAVASSINTARKTLPIEPYTLGAWLGDGTSANSQITTNDAELLEFIEKDGYEIVKTTSYLRYRITGLITKLKTLDLVKNKHIPIHYLRSSYSQRLALLQGLMDTDGHIDKKGKCDFVNTNKRLADDVFELVCSLGMKPTLTEGSSTMNGFVYGKKYTVRFCTDIAVVRLTRKAVRLLKSVTTRLNYKCVKSCEIVETVPVQCVEVDSPSHLYLIGKSFTPTHNSTAINQLVAAAVEQGAVACVYAGEDDAETYKYNMQVHVGGYEGSDIRENNAGALYAHVDPKYKTKINDWAFNKLFVITRKSGLNEDSIIENFQLAFERFGCDMFVVDNLMKLVASKDTQNLNFRQTQVVNKLSDFAKETRSHVHLIVHTNKDDDETAPPKNSRAVAGAKEIVNLCDSAINWFRVPEDKKGEYGNADAVCTILENRVFGKKAQVNLIFDWRIRRYAETIEQMRDTRYAL